MIRIGALIPMLEGLWPKEFRWRNYASDAAIIVVLLALVPVFMSRVPGSPVEEPPKASVPRTAVEEKVRPSDMSAISSRNIFSVEGRYKDDPKPEAVAAAAAPPPSPPPPSPKNYAPVKLVGILQKDGRPRAILREGAGEVIVLKAGDTLFDDLTVTGFTDNSVVLNNYCEQRTFKMFDVTVNKPPKTTIPGFSQPAK